MTGEEGGVAVGGIILLDPTELIVPLLITIVLLSTFTKPNWLLEAVGTEVI